MAVGEAFNHLFVVTHTDLDGVGCAAAILRILSRRPDESTILFAEPYNLHDKLGDLRGEVTSGDLVVVCDLGVNTSTLDKLLDVLKQLSNAGGAIEWYDHHVWPEDAYKKVSSAGVRLVVDRETCATGVVVKHASKLHGVEPDEFLNKLSSVVCSADLWVWDEHMASKLFRVLGRDEDEAPESVRRELIEIFFNGRLWDDRLNARLESYVNRELVNFNKVLRTVVVGGDKVRIAVAYKRSGPPSNSLIGAALLSRFKADIAVIVRGNGAVSLRSRSFDVSILAQKLGGGGHPRAAGAKVGIPLILKLISLIYPKAVSSYILSRVNRVLRELMA